MISALLVASALVSASADKWEIANPYTAKAKYTWQVTIEADMGSEKHEAKHKLVIEVGEPKDGVATPAVVMWKELEVDGNPMGDPEGWDVQMDAKQGTLSGSDEDNARMLAPYFFVFPTSAVEPTESWEAKVDRRGTEFKFTGQGVEKLGDLEVLKVKSTSKETKGDAAMTSEGTWWVSKDGKVQKFELSVRNWIVTMAGGEAFDAVAKGTLIKE